MEVHWITGLYERCFINSSRGKGMALTIGGWRFTSCIFSGQCPFLFSKWIFVGKKNYEWPDRDSKPEKKGISFLLFEEWTTEMWMKMISWKIRCSNFLVVDISFLLQPSSLFNWRNQKKKKLGRKMSFHLSWRILTRWLLLWVVIWFRRKEYKLW